jgi:molybdenum cofactor synthesis domain-containing protein
MPKTAGIILIGNEILSGKINDANAAWLCRELRELGVDVRRVSVIPDDVAVIAEEVATLSRRYDVVFTSGGVGPTHDDVTIEGAARGLGVAVVRHPSLVALLRRHLGGGVTAAHLKMAEVPDGAGLVDDTLGFPTIVAGNVYILPGVPEIFRQKFETIRERFREPPYYVKTVFVRIGEGTLAAHLNALLHEFPALLLGSYPELGNPEYRVKVTLESKDAAYLERALAGFLARLPGDAVVKVA